MAIKNESLVDGGLHVLKKTVEYVGYGALVCGAVALIPGSFLAAGGGLLSTLGFSGVSASGGMLLSVLPAMQFGALTGGLFGVTKGVLEAPEAIEMAKQDKMFMAQRNMDLQNKQFLMNQQMAMMGQGGGVNPSAGIPFNLQNQGVARVS